MRWMAGCVVLAGCCVIATTARAGGVATVQVGAKTLTVSFAGANARVDISGVQSAYLLLRGDQVYSVAQVNGQPLVLDAQAAAVLLAGGTSGTSPDMIQTLTRIAPTGAHETVAAHPGDVYTVTYEDMRGHVRTGRGVLGSQAEVQELTQVLGHIAILLQNAGHRSVRGTQQVLDALQQRHMGLLAYQDQFRVEKISASSPAPDLLTLPASPSQLPGNLGQLLQGLSPQPR